MGEMISFFKKGFALGCGGLAFLIFVFILLAVFIPNYESAKERALVKRAAEIAINQPTPEPLSEDVINIPVLELDPELTKTEPSPTPEATPTASPAPEELIFKEGDNIQIGYTSYIVHESFWQKNFSTGFSEHEADSVFLFVRLTVKNEDKKPRSIPPFKLYDESGAEYQSSSDAIFLKKSIDVLDSLNPSVQKEGYLLFDIPQNNQYVLKVSGGYWSGEDTIVRLAPKKAQNPKPTTTTKRRR